MKYTNRKCKGSAIAEFGPALFIILIMFLFPIMDMLYLAAAYASGWYENHLCVHEVACHDPTDASTIYNISTASVPGSVPQVWGNSGLCGWLGGPVNCGVVNTVNFILINSSTNNPIGSPVSAGPGCAPMQISPGVYQEVGFCNVKTTMNINPFVQLPWVGAVPGLNAPVTLTYDDQRPQEEKGFK